MEQKDYKLEIVNVLIGNSFHARELARQLDVNHMTLIRRLKDLVGENVLDLRVEGKNKIFFVKQSVEARNYIFMAEHYRLNRLLKKHPRLRNVLDFVAKDKRIGMAVLFGSYARGDSGESSDIDLFVETGSKNLKRELERLDLKLNIKIGKFDGESLLGKEIIKNHVVIKGVEKFYGEV